MRMRKITKTLKRHLPTICTVVSVVTGGLALYFTGKATVKAVRRYDELKNDNVEITPKVVFKELIIPYYIPAIGFATTSLGTNIAANVIHVKRNKKLTLVAKSAIESLRDFKANARNVIGEDKVKEIEQQQAKNAVTLVAGEYDDPIILYDVEERVKIKTTRRLLHNAENKVNEELSSSGWTRGYRKLRDFYIDLGLDEEKAKHILGSSKEWNVWYMGERDETSWVTFAEDEGFNSDGTPMIMLYYYPSPEYEETINKELE